MSIRESAASRPAAIEAIFDERLGSIELDVQCLSGLTLRELPDRTKVVVDDMVERIKALVVGGVLLEKAVANCIEAVSREWRVHGSSAFRDAELVVKQLFADEELRMAIRATRCAPQHPSRPEARHRRYSRPAVLQPSS